MPAVEEENHLEMLSIEAFTVTAGNTGCIALDNVGYNTSDENLIKAYTKFLIQVRALFTGGHICQISGGLIIAVGEADLSFRGGAGGVELNASCDIDVNDLLGAGFDDSPYAWKWISEPKPFSNPHVTSASSYPRYVGGGDILSTIKKAAKVRQQQGSHETPVVYILLYIINRSASNLVLDQGSILEYTKYNSIGRSTSLVKL
jgi:hypothetical protein